MLLLQNIADYSWLSGLELFGANRYEQYQQIHQGWIEDALKTEDKQRMLAWTQNLAVGSQDYLAKVKSELGVAGRHKTMVTEDDVHTLKEPVTSYMAHLGHEKLLLHLRTHIRD